jgi:hypothetical protein
MRHTFALNNPFFLRNTASVDIGQLTSSTCHFPMAAGVALDVTGSSVADPKSCFFFFFGSGSRQKSQCGSGSIILAINGEQDTNIRDFSLIILKKQALPLAPRILALFLLRTLYHLCVIVSEMDPGRIPKPHPD